MSADRWRSRAVATCGVCAAALPADVGRGMVAEAMRTLPSRPALAFSRSDPNCELSVIWMVLPPPPPDPTDRICFAARRVLGPSNGGRLSKGWGAVAPAPAKLPVVLPLPPEPAL